MAIQHVVLFKFTPDISQADQEELRQRVETSSNEIARMRELRFARLVPDESARGYHYLMSMVFEHHDDLDNYMDHPIHGELADWAQALGGEFLYFDYDLDEATALRQPA